MFRDKKNLSFGRLFITMMLMIITMLPAEGQNALLKKTDSQRLGIAITYFQGGKYHEAKLILQRLDKSYQLNPRFRAYLGVCYYYDQEYEKATNCLDSVILQLQAFDPQELSFYYYADGESYFTLGKYAQAAPLYDQTQARCHEDEKAKIYYRLGLCYSFLKQWYKALDALQSALVPKEKAKIAEIRNLIFACCSEINQPTS